jgi:uncharacterized protein (DUF362 family)
VYLNKIFLHYESRNPNNGELQRLMKMKPKLLIVQSFIRRFKMFNRNSWQKLFGITVGLAATAWFLIRVIPKPARAGYPCQRAAFPLASGFAFWLLSLFALKPLMDKIKKALAGRVWIASLITILMMTVFLLWTMTIYSTDSNAISKELETGYNFVPAKSNVPIGIAKGIFPGRVVWAHDPKATKWKGNWRSNADQYWLDKNTDQRRVDAMLVTTLTKLTGKSSEESAWESIFKYYNANNRGLIDRGYKESEIVAVKPNLNNCDVPNKTINYSDASPQLVLAIVRQLVHKAHVSPKNIIIYDVRRFIPSYLLTKVWNEFKDVRFVQVDVPQESQVKNAAYGDYHGLEAAHWVEGISYSNGKYDKARFIAKQIYDATYIVNMALLKAHSYPYNSMEDGDEGQTGISMCGKNHFGSIQGTWELHAAINTNQKAVKNAYSPIVDLEASPNLGAKTILFVLDGLYCGRKWRTYPIHFPNPPFNNAVEPYENSNWPASILASMDGVALDCVGLDIYHSQIKNNSDSIGHSRMLLRNNADDYLLEMAQANNPPSGTKYMQNGRQVKSLGVHEHWDTDSTRKYSRNLAPSKGKGIELIYLPL